MAEKEEEEKDGNQSCSVGGANKTNDHGLVEEVEAMWKKRRLYGTGRRCSTLLPSI